MDEKFKSAKLVIFIICPVFLEHIGQHPEQTRALCRHIRSDGVLAMLLGIVESTITDDHKSGKWIDIWRKQLMIILYYAERVDERTRMTG